MRRKMTSDDHLFLSQRRKVEGVGRARENPREEETNESAPPARKRGAKQFELDVEKKKKLFLSLLGFQRGSDLVIAGNRNKQKKFDFLHDFLSTNASSFKGLDFEEILFIHKTVLLCFHPDSLQSPASIHVSFSQNEIRLQMIQHILSALPSSSSARNETLISMYKAMNGSETALRMSHLFEAVFDGIISFIWSKVENLPFIKMSSGENVPPPATEPLSSCLSLISSLNSEIADLINDWDQSPKHERGGRPSLKTQWSSVVLLKIFFEALLQDDGCDWGVGESGRSILQLLKSSDVYSASFYDQFCLALGDFYSQFSCCLDCGMIIGHSKDQHRKIRSLCTSCQSLKVVVKNSNSSEKLALPQEFWNDFLAPPSKRHFGEKSKPKVNSASFRDVGEEELEQEGGNVFGGNKDHLSLFSWENEGSVPDKWKLQRTKFGSRRLIENLLVRYMEEILFPIGLTSKDFQQVDRLLVFHLSEITNSESFRLPITDKPRTEDQEILLFFDPKPSTRVALLNVLLRSERSQEQNPIGKGEVFYRITSSLGKRLYLAIKLNEFEETLGILKEDPASLEKLINYARPEDLDIGVNWEKLDEDFDVQDEPTKRARLDSLARIQVVLRRYGRLIGSESFPSESLLAHPVFKRFSVYFNKLLFPDQAENFRVFVFKAMKDMAGLDCILCFLLMREDKLCDWVRYDQGALQIVIEDSPFGPLVAKSNRGSELQELEILIKECLQDDILNEKKILMILDVKHSEKLLIPALHYQITNLASVERKNSERILKRANALGKSLSEGLKVLKPSFQFLSVILPFAVNIILLSSFPELDSPSLPRNIVAATTEEGQPLGNKAKILLQVQLRILIGASANPSSWLACLLVEPGEFTDRYLPASKFDPILDGHRWFECPNGHPYCVGECGLPRQKLRCPACGADIGGEYNRSVAGVKDAKVNPSMDLSSNLVGYHYVHGENVRCIEHYTTNFIRLLVNTCLFTSLTIPNGSPDGVSKLVRYPNDEKLRDEIMFLVGRDFDDLIHRNRLDSLLNGVLLNASLCLLIDKDPFWIPGSTLSSKEPIQELENTANTSVRSVMNDIQNTIKHRVDSSWQTSQRELILQRCLGQQMWDGLLESFLRPSQMWRFSPSVSLEHFTMLTTAVPSFEEKYPLINGFLENENRLELVRCIVPILEWHNLLFSVFQDNQLTRAQAQKITNADILSALPTQDEQERGQRVLRNFCNAFNQSFPIVDLIFECNKNLFLTEDGQVDLKMTGESNPMTPDTPIFFSLPNATRVGKEIDAQGHCTVQLLLYLHRIHEGAIGLDRNEQPQQRDPPAAGHDAILPIISCETPTHTLRQKLIFYNRQQDFIPLLTAFSSCKDSTLQYDFLAIENSLRFGVFGGKQSNELSIKYYQYKGDICEVAGVTDISAQIPQVPVSDFVMHLIFAEVNTQSRIVALLLKIKIVTDFFTVGGFSVKRMGLEKVLLRDYAVEVLEIPLDDWDEVSPPSVNEHIRLCHLRHLVEKIGVNDVLSNYTEALLPSHKEELQKHFDGHKGKYHRIVLPVLRDLLQTQLSGKGVENEIDPGLDLKDMLELKIDDDDDDYVWFDENFPAQLFEVRHGQALFEFLTTSQVK